MIILVKALLKRPVISDTGWWSNNQEKIITRYKENTDSDSDFLLGCLTYRQCDRLPTPLSLSLINALVFLLYIQWISSKFSSDNHMWNNINWFIALLSSHLFAAWKYTHNKCQMKFLLHQTRKLSLGTNPYWIFTVKITNLSDRTQLFKGRLALTQG